MMSWRMRFLVIVAVVALVTAGCRDSGGAPTSAGGGSEPDGESTEPQEIRIVAVDYAYTEAPAEIEAGVVNLTFQNQGAIGHEATLSGIGDTSIQQFVEDLGGRQGLEGIPVPDYLDQVAVPPFVSVDPGATDEATYTLTEGRYALWCSITDVPKGEEEQPHYQLGMIREVRVTGGTPEVELPQADGTITATDYAFEVDIDAGDRNVNFINEGPDQVHFSTVEVYPKGVDAVEATRAYEAFLEPGNLPEGVPRFKGLGFSGIFSEGLGSRFQLFRGAFESGRTYVFACFVPDREGGEPHAIAYNMFEVVTLE